MNANLLMLDIILICAPVLKIFFNEYLDASSVEKNA